MDKTGQNVQISRKSSFSQATYNIKTEEKTINSLSLCQFDAGKLAKGNVFPIFRTFCPVFVQLKSVLFNLPCVLGLVFSERRQSTLFQFCSLFLFDFDFKTLLRLITDGQTYRKSKHQGSIVPWRPPTGCRLLSLKLWRHSLFSPSASNECRH